MCKCPVKYGSVQQRGLFYWTNGNTVESGVKTP
jgi:hypothetical protein